MKHLKIVSKPGSKNQYIIKVEDITWGILSRRILLSYIGNELELDVDDGLLEEIRSEIRKSTWHLFLDYLALRERSVSECRQYLKRWKITGEMSEELIQKAIDKGYINNKRYAELLVSSLAERGKSRNEIKAKLRIAGIDAGTATDALKENLSSKEEGRILKETALKVLGKYKDIPERERFHKCMEYLVRRGFSYEASKEVLYRLGKLGEQDEFD
ncbi:MAG TPA: regulatory protein RecX [Candidatus Cloacimonadota bacterium]|nr:regulatory protein RecX [Candidatus Cloacimonadota bacterium]HPT71188.1 regulatory protein RecX [Candidatus Cloacimonadota bacterium]